MELNVENVSLFVTLLAAIFSANAFLWNKLDQIWKVINQIRSETVTRDECRRRRR